MISVGVWLVLGFAFGRAAALTGILALGLGIPLAAGLQRERPGWRPWCAAAGAALGVATVVPAAVATRFPLAMAVVAAATLVRPRPDWYAPAVLAVVAGGAAVLLHPAGPWLGLALAAALQGAVGLLAGALVVWCTAGARALGAWPPLPAAFAAGALGAACGRLPGGIALSAVLVAGYVALGPGRSGRGVTMAAVAAGLLPAAVFGPLALAATATGGIVAETSGRTPPALAVAAGNVGVSLAAMRTGWAWGLGALVGAALAVGIMRLAVWSQRTGVAMPAAPDRPRSGATVWAGRLQAVASECLALSRHLSATPAPAPQPVRGAMRLAEDVCPGCPALAACWERRLPRVQRMVRDLYAAAGRSKVTWKQVGGPDTILCLRPREMAEAANRIALLERQQEEFTRVAADQRFGAVPALISIGRELGELAAEVAVAREGLGTPGQPVLSPARRWALPPDRQRWGYRASGLSVPRQGQAVSGDALRCRSLSGDRVALALADGMGSGPEAAVLATATVEHVLACLAAGRSASDALRQANAQLLGADGADAFSTLDLAVLHLRGGVLEWYKMGAPASLLLRAGGVRQLSGGGLPAGILTAPAIRSGRLRLVPGDRLVLVSDGVLDGLAGSPRGVGQARPAWSTERLGRRWASLATPEILATGLVDAVLAHGDAGRHDDLAVLVCRLEAAPGEEGDRGGPTAP